MIIAAAHGNGVHQRLLPASLRAAISSAESTPRPVIVDASHDNGPGYDGRGDILTVNGIYGTTFITLGTGLRMAEDPRRLRLGHQRQRAAVGQWLGCMQACSLTCRIRCRMLCDMKQLDRRTVNFAPGEASFLDLYKERDTPEYLALHSMLPDVSTDSDSNIIKALVRFAHTQIQEEAMRLAYDRAVDSGEFDAESRAAMRRSRKTVSSIASEAE